MPEMPKRQIFTRSAYTQRNSVKSFFRFRLKCEGLRRDSQTTEIRSWISLADAPAQVLLLLPFGERCADFLLKQRRQHQNWTDGAPGEGSSFIGGPGNLFDQRAVSDSCDDRLEQ